MNRRRDLAEELDYDSSYGDYVNVPGFRQTQAFEPGDGSLSDDGLEPAWSDVVGDKGDVFYVEPSLNDPLPQPPSNPESILKSTSNNPSVQNNGVASSSADQTERAPKKKSKKPKVLKGVRKNNEALINNAQPQNHVNFSHTVTFHDAPTGLLREVELFVEPGKRNYGRRASLCESLFGIVPGRFRSRPYQQAQKVSNVNGAALEDTRIMVQMLLPDGEAHKSGSIKIGDWLMCVNDLEVDFDNINSVLSMISAPRKVKLTLQKLAVECEPEPMMNRKNNLINESLVRLMRGDENQEEADIPAILTRLPHVVLYLTLDVASDTMADRDDILYHFPKRDSKLTDIRGVFSTLTHLMKDVTNNTAQHSTLLVDSQLVHVAYATLQREVLVIAMPADRVCIYQIQHVLKDTTRLLELMFGSLKSAFTLREHHGKLDHFFTLTFQRLLLHEDMRQQGIENGLLVEPFLNSLPAVRTLRLSDEIKVNIDNSMSEFESADFAEMSDDYYDLRRSYTILGSCLFYKGYLLASHLGCADLLDIALYSQYYCLLVLSEAEQMGQVVVWREVFPTDKRTPSLHPQQMGFSPPEARWFLMIVGRRNCLFGVLLEAGGCAEFPSGHPAPDPFYVDQAKATLLQLESMGILAQCDTVLDAPDIPALISADSFFRGSKPSKADNVEPTITAVGGKGSSYQSSSKAVSPMKTQSDSMFKKNSPQLNSSGRIGRGGAVYDVDSDADSHSTGNSETSTPVMDRKAGSDNDSLGSSHSANMFKTSKRKRLLPSCYDVSGMRRSLDDMEGRYNSYVKLTAGLQNSLFHYVTMDTMDGVFVCPTQQELADLSGYHNNQLVQNFYQACLAIRKVFEKENNQGSERIGALGRDSSLSGVKEHGILFKCKAEYSSESSTNKKSAQPIMCYWVVGRLYSSPYPKEAYVCFHDGAVQNLVELAFKLSFGMSL